jgi:hypothetical protein
MDYIQELDSTAKKLINGLAERLAEVWEGKNPMPKNYRKQYAGNLFTKIDGINEFCEQCKQSIMNNDTKFIDAQDLFDGVAGDLELVHIWVRWAKEVHRINLKAEFDKFWKDAE